MKKISIPFLFFNIFITFVMILLIISVCDSVHASSLPDSNPLPYCVDYYKSSYFSSGFDYYLNTSISPDVRIFSEPFENNGEIWCQMYVIDFSDITFELKNHDLNSNVSYYDFDFTDDYLIINNARYINMVLRSDGYFHQVSSNTSDGSKNNIAFLGRSSGNINQYGYTPMVPFTLKTGSVLYNLSDNRQPILANGNPSDYRHGHALKPPRDSQDDPEYSSGDSAPSVVPNVSGSSSDTSLLAKTIQYFGNLINNNLNSNFENLYDNFSPILSTFSQLYNMGLDSDGNFNLLLGISNFFGYLFIPDPDDLSDLLVSHDIYGVIGLVEDTQSSVNHVKTMITGGENLYKLTLSQFVLAGKTLGPYDIDFSWYLNFKSIGDPIISAFLLFGYFMWLHSRLPYWMRGQQGDITLMTKEVQK